MDCFLEQGATKVTADTVGPFGESLRASYARLDHTAVIEMASAAGLPLAEGRLDPCRASTYGVGMLISHAVKHGCRKIVLGLGGSCTTDAGIGMAQALGTRFYDENEREFTPRADEMTRISHFDRQNTERLLDGIQITAMCDVDNPHTAKTGRLTSMVLKKGSGTGSLLTAGRQSPHPGRADQTGNRAGCILPAWRRSGPAVWARALWPFSTAFCNPVLTLCWI